MNYTALSVAGKNDHIPLGELDGVTRMADTTLHGQEYHVHLRYSVAHTKHW